MAATLYEYHYELYNPGQYPEEMKHINAMAEDGWRVHTALPSYNEIWILWEREAPKASAGEKKAASKDS